jgi:hypothetical protein
MLIVIDDYFNGSNAYQIAHRRGLLQYINDYIGIKRVVGYQPDLLEIQEISTKKKAVPAGVWIMAIRKNGKVAVGYTAKNNYISKESLKLKLETELDST